MTTSLQMALLKAGVTPEAAPERPRFKPDPRVPDASPRLQRARGEVRETIEAVAAMSDVDLQIERLALDEQIEAIRSQLYAEEQAEERNPSWRNRAERALSGLKSRQRICRHEAYERARVQQEAAAELRRERHAALMQAKGDRMRAHYEREVQQARGFVTEAKRVLPRDVYLSIWSGVPK